MVSRGFYWVAGVFILIVLLACRLFAQESQPTPSADRASPSAAPRTLTPIYKAHNTSAPIATLTAPSAPIEPDYLAVEISAPSLEGNLLGEPEHQFIQIYLPPSYDYTQLSYPVVYYLPGFGSTPHGDNAYFTSEDLASQMASGMVNEMIVVVPNGANLLHGSFFVNSPVTGNWEDFILQDVVGYIDDNYRTIADPGGRGIAGFSMGGFSAIDLAMRHPDIFSAAYGMSSALFDKNGLGDSMMFDSPGKLLPQLAQLEELSSLPTDEAIKQMIHYDGSLGFLVAYGAAFAPHPENGPPYFDYPIKEVKGEPKRIPELWERWQNGLGGWEWKVEQYQDNLASLKGIMLDYGTQDLAWIRQGSEYLSQQLSAAGIDHQVYVYEGGHGDRYPERIFVKMLPFFDRTLVDPE